MYLYLALYYFITALTSTTSDVILAGNIEDFRTLVKRVVPHRMVEAIYRMTSEEGGRDSGATLNKQPEFRSVGPASDIQSNPYAANFRSKYKERKENQSKSTKQRTSKYEWYLDDIINKVTEKLQDELALKMDEVYIRKTTRKSYQKRKGSRSDVKNDDSPPRHIKYPVKDVKSSTVNNKNKSRVNVDRDIKLQDKPTDRSYPMIAITSPKYLIHQATPEEFKRKETLKLKSHKKSIDNDDNDQENIKRNIKINYLKYETSTTSNIFSKINLAGKDSYKDYVTAKEDEDYPERETDVAARETVNPTLLNKEYSDRVNKKAVNIFSYKNESTTEHVKYDSDTKNNYANNNQVEFERQDDFRLSSQGASTIQSNVNDKQNIKEDRKINRLKHVTPTTSNIYSRVDLAVKDSYEDYFTPKKDEDYIEQEPDVAIPKTVNPTQNLLNIERSGQVNKKTDNVFSYENKTTRKVKQRIRYNNQTKINYDYKKKAEFEREDALRLAKPKRSTIQSNVTGKQNIKEDKKINRLKYVTSSTSNISPETSFAAENSSEDYVKIKKDTDYIEREPEVTISEIVNPTQYLLNKKRSDQINKKSLDISSRDKATEIKYDNETKSYYDNNKNVKFERKDAIRINSFKTSTIESPVYKKEHIKKDSKFKRLKYITSTTSNIFSEVNLAAKDSYEDYVTPKKDEDYIEQETDVTKPKTANPTQYYLNKERSNQKHKKTLDNSGYDNETTTEVKQHIRYDIETKNNYANNHKVEFERQDTSGLNSERTATIQSNVNDKQNLKQDIKTNRLKYVTSTTSNIFSEVNLAVKDSYEDYVTPKKDEDYIESEPDVTKRKTVNPTPHYLNKERSEKTNKKTIDIFNYDNKSPAKIKEHIKYDNETKINYEYKKKVEFERKDALRLDSNKTSTIQGNVNIKQNIEGDRKIDRLKHVTSTTSKIFSEMNLSVKDSYEDYVTPKKDEDYIEEDPDIAKRKTVNPTQFYLNKERLGQTNKKPPDSFSREKETTKKIIEYIKYDIETKSDDYEDNKKVEFEGRDDLRPNSYKTYTIKSPVYKKENVKKDKKNNRLKYVTSNIAEHNTVKPTQYYLNKERTGPINRQVVATKTKEHIKYNSKTKSNYENKKKVELERQNAYLLNSHKFSSTQNSVDYKENIKKDRKWNRLKYLTSSTSNILSEVTLAVKDNYEDYVTPKKDEDYVEQEPNPAKRKTFNPIQFYLDKKMLRNHEYETTTNIKEYVMYSLIFVVHDSKTKSNNEIKKNIDFKQKDSFRLSSHNTSTIQSRVYKKGNIKNYIKFSRLKYITSTTEMNLKVKDSYKYYVTPRKDEDYMKRESVVTKAKTVNPTQYYLNEERSGQVSKKVVYTYRNKNKTNAMIEPRFTDKDEMTNFYNYEKKVSNTDLEKINDNYDLEYYSKSPTNRVFENSPVLPESTKQEVRPHKEMNARKDLQTTPRADINIQPVKNKSDVRSDYVALLKLRNVTKQIYTSKRNKKQSKPYITSNTKETQN